MGSLRSLGRLWRTVVLVGIAAVLVGVPLGASAPPDIADFELDGNAVSNGGKDWDALGGPLFSTGVIEDGTGTSDVGYGTGSNKDTDDISSWSWAVGQVTPAKNNIAHAYAAVYEEDGNLILYFGQDRLLDRQGDANVGFWFLQNAVGLGANGKFTGSHANGDLLVQSEFTNGGSVSSVRVYRWNNGSLQLVESDAQCVGGKLGTENACGIVNTGDISTSWAGTITSPYFYEGGLNLSSLFPDTVPCFSTFLTNTRTSQQNTAELKDFAFGTLDTCGSIKVVKQASPNDGTKFGYTTTGLNPSSFELGAGESRTFDKLPAGSYSVSENEPTGGWDFDSLSCTGGSSQISGRTASITLGFLQDVECTYVNKPKPGTLTVIKNVVNDNGGTKVASDFQIQVSGSSPSPASFAGQGAPGTQVTIGAGSYNVTETVDPAYAVTYSADCSGTMPAGGSKTCVITNDDRPATLIVKKVVVNDNGGTKVASDFSFQVNGGTAQAFEADGQNDLTVNAGTYSVTEVAVDGYSTSYDNCANVVLAVGQTATCTITNDDQPATLIVKKVVINDNGGTKVASDFSFQVNGGAAQAFEADGQNDLTVNAGTYSVTEVAADGYTTTYDNCSNLVIPNGGTATCTITNDDQAATLIVKKVVVNDDGGTASAEDFSFRVNGGAAQAFEADGQNDLAVQAGTYSVTEVEVEGYTASYDNCSNLVIPNGGSATCTITNDDQPARLKLVKEVVNDDGGTNEASDWTLSADGPTPLSGDGMVEGDVSAGTYTLSEDGPGGYDAGEWSCEGGSLEGAELTLGLGENAECTIVNDDRPATLIVKKVVVNDNGGTKVASDFSFQVNGGAAQAFEADGQNDLTVNAGTYSVTEVAVDGYSTSYDNCANVVLAVGQTATCTITNDDQPATLIVKKVVVNDNGGTKVASDFSFQVNGGAAQAFEADGQNDLTVNAGTYSVTEVAADGYTTTYDSCTQLQLGIGESATCTITNNDLPKGVGAIRVSKSANQSSVKEPGGPVTYSVSIRNTSDVLVTIENVVDDKFGDLDDSGGNGCFDVPINLAPGETANCQFTANVTGAGGTQHVNTVTATGKDASGNNVSGSDDEVVQITQRLIDLVVDKTASSPTPLNGTVNYTMTVTNKGPDTATNVQLADPAPAGITFLSATPSQGTCSVAASLITCNLGTIAPGQTVTVNATGRATAVGTHVNTVTVSGQGGRETNPADNTDSAQTVVPAPLQPPTPPSKPPVVVGDVCLTLTVTPKNVTADGKPDKVRTLVTAGKKRMKGVRVVVKGAGVSKSGRTNAQGVAIIAINPRKSGIVTVTAQERNRKVCGAKRIGVVGVFLPPLTG